MTSPIDRRRFLQFAGGSVAATMLGDSIARAASIPAHRVTRSINDVEHIVVLMQENRSFDHYYGALRGVRGFGDPHPIILPNGQPVWQQANPGGSPAVVPPFRPDVEDLALTFIEDLPHDWDSTHAAFNAGNWDGWIPAKSTTTMAHLQRSDLPFHYALADAFTLADGYHCSMLGPTDPNRYYMWTGWDGNDGKHGGPVIANDEIGYSWQTYPERLSAAGVSWKIYQDVGDGLTGAEYWGYTDDPYIGNYGDNSLLYFTQFQNSQPGSPLYEAALSGTNVSQSGGFFDQLTADVQGGNLPSVSWVVAPEAYTEHPAWPAGYGAWYTAAVINALTSDPEVWARTVLLITFDENDGFFDHVPAPYPNVGTLPGASTVPLDNELFAGLAGTPGGSDGVVGPYGGGIRVPLLAISPWSTGGYVSSETFDHTSLIRFIEARFGVEEPNITPWRRAVFGDLTSCFDFASARGAVPTLPDVSSYQPDPKQVTPPDYHPVPPAQGAVPTQEPGTRPSRRLGYRFNAAFTPSPTGLELAFTNPGSLGVGIQARSLTIAGAPFTYTVGAGDKLAATLPNPGVYDLSLHGPNGWYRHFSGSPATTIELTTVGDHALGLVTLQLRLPKSGRLGASHRPAERVTVQIADAYGHDRELRLRPETIVGIEVAHSGGWYDLTVTAPEDPSFTYALAGRLELTRGLTSDPQLGAA